LITASAIVAITAVTTSDERVVAFHIAHSRRYRVSCAVLLHLQDFKNAVEKSEEKVQLAEQT
jgi:hypothetical protein